ncbi:ATP-binding protein [Pedobacter jamesrossensis]|uniref:ATP-binding protein n=1 Tax=Pedobacter jamesrossensis TaxID=1908238 RepID=UPI0036230C69
MVVEDPVLSRAVIRSLEIIGEACTNLDPDFNINAIKFSPSGTNIEVAMQVDSKKVVVSVKDYGVGIPEDIGRYIFSMNELGKRSGTAGET